MSIALVFAIVVLVLLIILLIGSWVVIQKSIPDNEFNLVIGVTLLTVFMACAVVAVVAIKTAEHKMYEQIRDGVDIKSHILYKKWLLDNPKGEIK